MKLFSKMKAKDNNMELEKVLESKYFSANIKSLLLSMVYKIENSYSDYQKVKALTKTKKEFVKQIIEIIRDYCDNIKLVEPDSKEAELLKKNGVFAFTNYKERSILAMPTELSLLYAVIDILPKYYYIENTFEFKKALQTVLVEGINQNILEVLSDFNGWSWDVNLEYKNSLYANLIYQNFVIIFGNTYMENWLFENKSKKSTISLLKKMTNKTKYFNYLCEYLYLISSKDDKIKIEEKYKIEKKPKINVITKLQIEFVRYLKIVALKINENDDIIRLIYQLRYFKEIYISKNLKIKMVKSLEKEIDEVFKILITKASKNAIIRMIDFDIDSNFRIINKILDTKIIELEDIRFKMKDYDSSLKIEIYEKDILEKEIVEEVKKEDLALKINKKYKLFN